MSAAGNQGVLQFISENFWHVAPILAAGVIGGAIIFERSVTLFKIYHFSQADDFFNKLRTLLIQDRTQEAVALCNYFYSKPIALVAKEGILRIHLPEESIIDGIQITVGKATQLIQKRTGFLSMIANVATLLGLVGTIAGLIASFQAVGSANPQEKAALLANGISTAMNATLLGLAVAIPCMVAFSFLANKSNRLCAEIEHAGVQTLDLIRQRLYSSHLQVSESKLASVRSISGAPRRGAA